MSCFDISLVLVSTRRNLNAYYINDHHSSSLTFNVTNCQNDMSLLFISIDRMPFLSPTLDDADPLFALVITPGFYLQKVEGGD